jgi:DNA-directed RNA polymerase subunit RPC12/RpoP
VDVLMAIMDTMTLAQLQILKNSLLEFLDGGVVKTGVALDLVKKEIEIQHKGFEATVQRVYKCRDCGKLARGERIDGLLIYECKSCHWSAIVEEKT